MIKTINVLLCLALLASLMLLLSSCQSSPPVSSASSKKTAPFAVGSQTVFIHDTSRPYDSVGGVDVGIRSMITEIWYPVERKDAQSGDYQVATYGDYVFGDRAVHRLMMTKTTFFHLTPETVAKGVSQNEIDAAISELFTRQRGSVIDAPLARTKQRFPVLVMTHGDAGSRYNMESACEYLAAHGFIVIAPEHTGNSPYSLTGRDPEINGKLSAVKPFLNPNGTYGSIEKYGQSYTPLINDRANPKALRQLDDSLLQRVNDLRATLDELEVMNVNGKFKGRLDLSRIGVFGRSFGGTTTLAALSLEPRFSAGAAVVPLVLPDVRTATLRKPAGVESVILNATGRASIHQMNKPTMLLSGAEDSLIIRIGAAFSESLNSEKPTQANPLPQLKSIYNQSSSSVIWGLLENSNHGSFGVSGPYWWPELKPKSQARYFTPDSTFNLIDAEIAHDIQRRKLLHFFDAMIKAEIEGFEKLLQNQFFEQGLQYEFRNF